MNESRDFAALTRTKLAAIREPGYPVGQPAPTFFHCPCGEKVPAFQGEQTCACGTRYDSRGWVLA